MNIRSKFPDEISELWFLQYTHGVYLYYDYWLFDNQSDLLKQSIIVINILINQTLPRLEHRAYHKNDYSGRMIISYCVNFHVHSQRNVTNVSLRNFQIFTQHTHTHSNTEKLETLARVTVTKFTSSSVGKSRATFHSAGIRPGIESDESVLPCLVDGGRRINFLEIFRGRRTRRAYTRVYTRDEK